MTLTVEDGTGVASANTYVSVGGASSYHAKRGTLDAWGAVVSGAAVEGMLIEATRRIDKSYAFRTAIATTTQGLALPRQTIYLEDGRQVAAVAQIALAADAVAWLALRLFNDQTAGGERTAQSESWPDYTVTYADAAVSYSELDAILAPIVDSGGFGSFRSGKVVRWS